MCGVVKALCVWQAFRGRAQKLLSRQIEQLEPDVARLGEGVRAYRIA